MYVLSCSKIEFDLLLLDEIFSIIGLESKPNTTEACGNLCHDHKIQP